MDAIEDAVEHLVSYVKPTLSLGLHPHREPLSREGMNVSFYHIDLMGEEREARALWRN